MNFFKGRIAGVAAARRRRHSAEGTRPWSAASPTARPRRSPGTLGVRPEALNPDGPRQFRDLAGTVHTVERLGGETYLYLSTGRGPTSRCMRRATWSWQPGDELRIGFSADKCHLFTTAARRSSGSSCEGDPQPALRSPCRSHRRRERRPRARRPAGGRVVTSSLPASGVSRPSPRLSASARPCAGRVVLGSIPISRASPRQGGSGVPPELVPQPGAGKACGVPRQCDGDGVVETADRRPGWSKSCEIGHGGEVAGRPAEIDGPGLAGDFRPVAGGAGRSGLVAGS